MAKRSFSAPNYTPTATGDASALAGGTYQAIQGGSATQVLRVPEVMASGMAGASAPTILQFARASNVGAAITALAAPNSDGPLHPLTAALAAAPITFTAATTGPQRSAATTDPRLDMSINAFGGIKRWVAAPDEEWWIFGNAASAGMSLLSAYSGGTAGVLNSHIVYEPF